LLRTQGSPESFDAAPFTQTLRSIAATLNGSGIRWCLAASGSLYVQGLPIAPHDIDIVVDMTDLEVARAVLEDCLVSAPSLQK